MTNVFTEEDRAKLEEVYAFVEMLKEEDNERSRRLGLEERFKKTIPLFQATCDTSLKEQE